MKTYKISNIFTFIAFAMIVLFVFLLRRKQNNKDLLSINRRFTVATVTEIEYQAGSSTANYTYRYKKYIYNKYFFITSEMEDKCFSGKRFYISFYPLDPSIHHVYEKIDVPVQYAVVPKDGWDTLPGYGRNSELPD